MGNQEGSKQDSHPKVNERIVSKYLWVVKTFCDLLRPDLGPVVA